MTASARRRPVALDNFGGTAAASKLGDWVARVVRGYGRDPEVVALSGEGLRGSLVGCEIVMEASDH